MYVLRNIQAPSRYHFCGAKARIITYSERVSVALFIQRERRMRHAILSSVVCLAVPYFSTLSHKRHNFREQKLLNINFFLQILSRTFLIPRRNHRYITINVHGSSWKLPVILVRY
jgi:hypothetical protein